MIRKLKNHPFSVAAYFKRSLVLTFAVPIQELESRIPECLRLDTYQEKWAFLAIAMVQTEGLRPKGFPKIFGNDFFLMGVRIFVRYTDKRGRNLRGLYIIKSETNKKLMAFFGNIFTHYNYSTTDIAISHREGKEQIESASSNFRVLVNREILEPNLPIKSPFSDWKTARRFAGPLPFTFTYNATRKEVLIIEGVRKNWKPSPVAIDKYSFDVLEKLDLKGAVLANAFEVCDVPYFWRKGRIEKWE